MELGLRSLGGGKWVSQEEATPADEIVAHLRSSAAFGDLSHAALQRLASTLQPVSFSAGSHVVNEGEAAAEAYIVVTGRLEVVANDDDGQARVVAEVGPGGVVGEMSLISGEPRSATVRAARDSQLLQLSAEDFGLVVREDPAVLLQVTRTIVRRLDSAIHGRRPHGGVNVVALLPGGGASVHRDFASQLAPALQQQTSVATVTGDDLANVAESAVAGYLNRVERENGITLLVADDDPSEWTNRAVRQADLVLYVADAAQLVEVHETEREQAAKPVEAQPGAHLVVLQGSAVPYDTAAALAQRAVQRVHHIRRGVPADVQRLARIVTGTATGLVLGGGGARGFAHFGVIRALSESGIPVDHVGGASIGASVAAGVAMGLDWKTMLEQERAATVDRSLMDLSFPAVALAQGRRLTASARANYGDRNIEDLWNGFFCVSTDLTAGSTRVHTAGPLWQAVRASTSIPGIFPPVKADDGHVLVDGAVLNNLPSDVMATTFRPGTIIAVDLEGAGTLPAADLAADGVVSGWRVLGRRLTPWKSRLQIPRMVDVLTRANSVSRSDGADLADLVIRPPVESFGTLAFDAYDKIADAGYRHAAEVLEHWNNRLAG